MGYPRGNRSPWVWLAAIGLSLALLIPLLSGCAVNAATSSTTPTSALTSAATATVAATAKCGDAFDYSSVPATPTAIPGPMAAHINATIAADPFGSKPTTRITAGDRVYVLAFTPGIPSGESHVVSVAWYLNGQRLDLSSKVTQVTVTGNQRADFNIGSAKAPAIGGVRIYFDLPQSDATLAQTFTFGLYC